jgi:peptidoglycan/xylan/chitin deacetylase (PgdA/CDA1 family)
MPKAALKTVAKAKAVEKSKSKEVRLASITPKKLNIPRPALRPDPALLRLTPPDITRGSTDSMKISITFDGGSNATETAMILNTLKSKGIKTTIFLAGSFIKKYPALVRRMVRDGHEIGNHTMSHPHLTTYDKDRRHRTLKGFTKSALREELDSAAELFMSATGHKMAPLWRAPYGEVNSELRRWAFNIGYIHIGWTTDRERKESLDTLDWVSDEGSKLYLTSREIRDRILNFGKGSKDGLSGGIVLMNRHR